MGTSSFHAMRKGARKCYFIFLMSAASAEMAILEEGVCVGSWQTVGSPAPLPDQLPRCPLCTTSHPCPAYRAAPEGRWAPIAAKTCSALSTLQLLLCRLLVLWRRKCQTCSGLKTSEMISEIPFFLLLSICLLIHPCLTKTVISKRVGPHTKDHFL